MQENPSRGALACPRRPTGPRESSCVFNFPEDLGGRHDPAWQDYVTNRGSTLLRDAVMVVLINLPGAATGAKTTWRSEPSEGRRKGDLTKCPLNSPTTRNAGFACATRPRAIAGFCRAARERFLPFGTTTRPTSANTTMRRAR